MGTSRYATDATTLGEAELALENEGFAGQFAVVDDGQIQCFTCHVRSSAADMELEALIRVEGASDPDDMAVVAAVACPACGTQGTLILKYGADSSIEDAEALRLLEDRRTAPSGGTSSKS